MLGEIVDRCRYGFQFIGCVLLLPTLRILPALFSLNAQILHQQICKVGRLRRLFCEAKTTLANETLTSGLYYKWYRATNSITGWEQIAGANGKTITVKASEVDCTREYMVEVYNDKAMGKDNLLGFDFQTVIDASDPYDIEPNPTPADESISEDEAGNGTVAYTPRMIVRGKSEAVETKFYFTLKSGSGVVLNTEAARKPTVQLSSFAVTREDCIHAGYSNVALTIQSVK